MISDFPFEEILIAIKSRKTLQLNQLGKKLAPIIYSDKYQNQKQKILDDQSLPEYSDEMEQHLSS